MPSYLVVDADALDAATLETTDTDRPLEAVTQAAPDGRPRRVAVIDTRAVKRLLVVPDTDDEPEIVQRPVASSVEGTPPQPAVQV
jgi:hypothetical protein